MMGSMQLILTYMPSPDVAWHTAGRDGFAVGAWRDSGWGSAAEGPSPGSAVAGSGSVAARY